MKTEHAIDAPVEALQKGGFIIKPWLPAAAIAKIVGGPQRDMRMFGCGSIHGLLEICHDALNVVALANDKPHNGQFAKCIGRLERVADGMDVTFRVVEFWNQRLLQWFVRRGYSAGNHPEWGQYAQKP